MEKDKNFVAKGVDYIARERSRQFQLDYKSYTGSKYKDNELLKAAICYASNGLIGTRPNEKGILWPWDKDHWKPKAKFRNLVKAGALIAAELDRMLLEENPKEEIPVIQKFKEGDQVVVLSGPKPLHTKVESMIKDIIYFYDDVGTLCTESQDAAELYDSNNQHTNMVISKPLLESVEKVQSNVKPIPELKKPTIGILPKHLRMEERYRELAKVMYTKLENNEAVRIEWIEEFKDLHTQIFHSDV